MDTDDDGRRCHRSKGSLTGAAGGWVDACLAERRSLLPLPPRWGRAGERGGCYENPLLTDFSQKTLNQIFGGIKAGLAQSPDNGPSAVDQAQRLGTADQTQGTNGLQSHGLCTATRLQIVDNHSIGTIYPCIDNYLRFSSTQIPTDDFWIRRLVLHEDED